MDVLEACRLSRFGIAGRIEKVNKGRLVLFTVQDGCWCGKQRTSKEYGGKYWGIKSLPYYKFNRFQDWRPVAPRQI